MKSKQGSIIIGFTLVLSIFVVLTAFLVESFTVYALKEKLEDSVDNATSAASLQANYEVIDGMYSNFSVNELLANEMYTKILNHSVFETGYTTEVKETLYVVNVVPQTITVEGKDILVEYPSVIGFKEIRTKSGFAFYKDTAIQSLSIKKIDLKSCLEDGLTLEVRTQYGCKIK